MIYKNYEPNNNEYNFALAKATKYLSFSFAASHGATNKNYINLIFNPFRVESNWNCLHILNAWEQYALLVQITKKKNWILFKYTIKYFLFDIPQL